MVKGTLNELSQLRQSGFGQPSPRHGLNLLYWFANEYIDFSYGEIVLQFRPQSKNFGFKKFHNRIEDEDHIVPIQNLPYYEVGNLNAQGADDLPNYVRAKYSHNNHNSNKDRIIVRLACDGSVNRVYVTEHSDRTQFDSSKTYRVSQGLLQIIKNITRENFLSQVTSPEPVFTNGIHYTTQQCYQTPQETVRQSYYTPSPPPPPPQNDSWCAIL